MDLLAEALEYTANVVEEHAAVLSRTVGEAFVLRVARALPSLPACDHGPLFGLAFVRTDRGSIEHSW